MNDKAGNNCEIVAKFDETQQMEEKQDELQPAIASPPSVTEQDSNVHSAEGGQTGSRKREVASQTETRRGDQPESTQSATVTTSAGSTTNKGNNANNANDTGKNNRDAADRPRFPRLSLHPNYPVDWDGSPPMGKESKDDNEEQAVERIFDRLGPLKLLQSDKGSQDDVSGTFIAQCLIRRLLKAQIFIMGKEKKDPNGYTTGSEILDPSKNTFQEDIFLALFSGIMAETQVQVPHYIYTIKFCDKLTNMNTGEMSFVDPDFTVAVLSLIEVLKNIHEGSIRQFDLSSSAAYGWLNIWLLGVQKILICKNVSSDQHLRMFRNAVAHNQFDMYLNCMQLFNRVDKRQTMAKQKADSDESGSVTSEGNGSINWMSRISLKDLFEVSLVLKMLHIAGYILNSSRDYQNMNRMERRRNEEHWSSIKILKSIYPDLSNDMLESLLKEADDDPLKVVRARSSISNAV